MRQHSSSHARSSCFAGPVASFSEARARQIDRARGTSQTHSVRRVTIVLLLLCGVWTAAAGAAGAPRLTATVKTLSPTSRLVRIVNRDQVTYRNFIVETQNKPQLLAVD